MAVPPTIVEFQDTSSLQFGGVWISSDFYSHPGGYRLCLVLKSTKIDRPTNQRRITKPSQEIAIIALDDGSTDRQWPCEGTATMRFEFPRQKHLRGGPNPPFLVNFSIGQPSANVELRVKFQGNLPPGFMRSWTSIPQDCIPVYLEYSPPSIFDRDKPPFLQHAGILTNCTGNITVKIEDIQIALKGVKRALDSSPPEGIKKLELDPQLNKRARPISVAPSGSPGELRVNHRLPTTAELSWIPVPKDKQNGVITGYTVQVMSADSTSRRPEISVDKDATSVEIPNLKPSTEYTFKVSAKSKAGSGPAATTSSKTPKGHWYQSTASKAFLLTALCVLILSITVAVYYSDKTDSQTIREHEKSFSPQPKCSWNEFKQTAKLTRIEKLNDLRRSVEVIGDWQSLCRNLDVNEADMNRIMNEEYKAALKKDDCLQSYFNSNKAYWEEVVIAVARPPFNNKRLAETIAEKHLEHSPNKDTILAMINSCDAYY